MAITTKLLVAVTLAGVLPAAAQDPYPVQGYFNAVLDEPVTKLALQTCALSFFEQRSDGSFVTYHVDLENFASGRPLRYLVVNRGQCTYDAASRIEDCLTTEGQDASDTHYYDAIVEIEADRITTRLFDNSDQMESYKDTGEGGAGTLVYYRCPLDDEIVSGALTPEMTTLTPDEINRLRFPDDALLASPEVARLAKAVGN